MVFGMLAVEFGNDIAKEYEMEKGASIYKVALASCLLLASGAGYARYDSLSTGVDGAFNPTTSQAIQLPPDGIFNYSTVNIPSGVKITYIKNAANTPVTILASGDVTIVGTIDVSGTVATNFMSGGKGGPGGFDGGDGGAAANASTKTASWVNGYTGVNVGRAGQGPGGGAPGAVHKPSYNASYADASVGGGGAYGTAPPAAGGSCPTTPGVVYGNPSLIPLVGGSGGGGGAGGPAFNGSGGGGGGGAILIASSGTISITGAVLANGAAPVAPIGTIATGKGAYGGGGSGGAIRLIATTVSGNGAISATGGLSVAEFLTTTSFGFFMICSDFANNSMHGGAGRIRIEAENLVRTAATTPLWTTGMPGMTSPPGLPTLSVTSIGGVSVPSGNSSIALPMGFTNPVTVNFQTSGVTVGSSITLTVVPARGVAITATSAPTIGNNSSATANVSVTLPSGTNTLQASVTYTVVASVGDAMSIYAQGERVEKVTLASTLGSKETKAILITVSGKEYEVPTSVLAMAAMQG